MAHYPAKGGGSLQPSLLDVSRSEVHFKREIDGNVLTYVKGEGWIGKPAAVSGGGGSVTSINTGTGLTGGPITSTGTISLNADLNALTDVTISNPLNNGQFLVHSNGQWINQSLEVTTVYTSATDLTNRSKIITDYATDLNGRLIDVYGLPYSLKVPSSGDIGKWLRLVSSVSGTYITDWITPGITDLAGVAISSPTPGQVLVYSSSGGGTWINAAVPSSVTSVTAGTGLATTPSGGITSTGSIGLATLTLDAPDVNGPSTFFLSDIDVDAYGRVTKKFAKTYGFVAPNSSNDGKFLRQGTSASGSSPVTLSDVLIGTTTTPGNLGDVQLTLLADQQILKYDDAAKKWINSAVSGGSSGTVTSITAGDGLAVDPLTSGGNITTSGTLTLETVSPGVLDDTAPGRIFTNLSVDQFGRTLALNKLNYALPLVNSSNNPGSGAGGSTNYKFLSQISTTGGASPTATLGWNSIPSQTYAPTAGMGGATAASATDPYRYMKNVFWGWDFTSPSSGLPTTPGSVSQPLQVLGNLPFSHTKNGAYDDADSARQDVLIKGPVTFEMPVIKNSSTTSTTNVPTNLGHLVYIKGALDLFRTTGGAPTAGLVSQGFAQNRPPTGQDENNNFVADSATNTNHAYQYSAVLGTISYPDYLSRLGYSVTLNSQVGGAPAADKQGMIYNLGTDSWNPADIRLDTNVADSSVVTPSTGNVLSYDSSIGAGKWKNKPLLGTPTMGGMLPGGGSPDLLNCISSITPAAAGSSNAYDIKYAPIIFGQPLTLAPPEIGSLLVVQAYKTPTQLGVGYGTEFMDPLFEPVPVVISLNPYQLINGTDLSVDPGNPAVIDFKIGMKAPLEWTLNDLSLLAGINSDQPVVPMYFNGNSLGKPPGSWSIDKLRLGNNVKPTCLEDVNVGTLSNGQVLSYNIATNKWVNTTPTTGTVTSINIGSGLTSTQAPITTSATLSLSPQRIGNAGVVAPSGGGPTLADTQSIGVYRGGQCLRYDAGTDRWGNQYLTLGTGNNSTGTTVLAGSSFEDVNVVSLVGNQFLRYNTTAGVNKWQNVTLSLTSGYLTDVNVSGGTNNQFLVRNGGIWSNVSALWNNTYFSNLNASFANPVVGVVPISQIGGTWNATSPTLTSNFFGINIGGINPSGNASVTGQVLRYDASINGGNYFAVLPALGSATSFLSDVAISTTNTATLNGRFLRHDGTRWVDQVVSIPNQQALFNLASDAIGYNVGNVAAYSTRGVAGQNGINRLGDPTVGLELYAGLNDSQLTNLGTGLRNGIFPVSVFSNNGNLNLRLKAWARFQSNGGGTDHCYLYVRFFNVTTPGTEATVLASNGTPFTKSNITTINNLYFRQGAVETTQGNNQFRTCHLDLMLPPWVMNTSTNGGATHFGVFLYCSNSAANNPVGIPATINSTFAITNLTPASNTSTSFTIPAKEPICYLSLTQEVIV